MLEDQIHPDLIPNQPVEVSMKMVERLGRRAVPEQSFEVETEKQISNLFEQCKKGPWLFRGFVGDYTTRLCGDYDKPL